MERELFMKSPTSSLLALIVLVALAPACVTHIRPYKPKVRNYKPAKYDVSANNQMEGSLWNANTDSLFTHRRSTRIGDMLTVVIRETANAARGAGTDLSRKSEMSLGIGSFAGAMTALKAALPDMDPAKLIEAMSKNDFSGQGKTTSSGELYATLTVHIKQLMPNGDLYIEGNKVVMINEEESHLYISGVVRPSDIEADNRIDSNLNADAQVEYTGRGPVSDKQKPGWFSRLFDWVTPI